MSLLRRKPSKPKREPEAIKRLLTSPEALATPLFLWACDQFGSDPKLGPYVLHWHPKTIRKEIRDAVGVTILPANLDRLMTAIAVVTSDQFFIDVNCFIQFANVLSGDQYDPEVFDPADPWECAWAVTESLLLWPPGDGEGDPFSDEVRRYIGATLREYGFVKPPDVLRIAVGADFSSQVRYDYADEPEFFAAIHEVQTEKTASVDEAVHEGLNRLLSQLQLLSLEHGDTAELEQRIAGVLAQAADRRRQAEQLH